MKSVFLLLLLANVALLLWELKTGGIIAKPTSPAVTPVTNTEPIKLARELPPPIIVGPTQPTPVNPEPAANPPATETQAHP